MLYGSRNSEAYRSAPPPYSEDIIGNPINPTLPNIVMTRYVPLSLAGAFIITGTSAATAIRNTYIPIATNMVSTSSAPVTVAFPVTLESMRAGLDMFTTIADSFLEVSSVIIFSYKL